MKSSLNDFPPFNQISIFVSIKVYVDEPEEIFWGNGVLKDVDGRHYIISLVERPANFKLIETVLSLLIMKRVFLHSKL